jgi:hypothetical protein
VTEAQFGAALERMVGRASGEQPDWNDVLGRVERARQQRVRVIAALTGACVLALVATAFAYGPGLWEFVAGTRVDKRKLGAQERGTLALAAHGRSLTPAERARLQDEPLATVKSVRLIANRGGYTFYIIELNDQRCFAFGHVGKDQLFGTPECPAVSGYEFPTPEHPVLDKSIVEASVDKPNPHIFRLQGFAADAVKEIAFRRANGELVARTPVRDNVYLRSTGLPDDTDTIVALDASGKELWSNCPPVRPGSDEEPC